MIKKIEEVVAFMKEKGVTIEELNAYYGLASKANFTMVIDGFFEICGTVVTGRVDEGCLHVGMDVALIDGGNIIRCKCVAIEKYCRLFNACTKGDYVAIKIEGDEIPDIKRGMTLVSIDKLDGI